MKANVPVCDSAIAHPTQPRVMRPVSADDSQASALGGEVALTLETRQAQRLVKGRSAATGRPASSFTTTWPSTEASPPPRPTSATGP